MLANTKFYMEYSLTYEVLIHYLLETAKSILGDAEAGTRILSNSLIFL